LLAQCRVVASRVCHEVHSQSHRLRLGLRACVGWESCVQPHLHADWTRRERLTSELIRMALAVTMASQTRQLGAARRRLFTECTRTGEEDGVDEVSLVINPIVINSIQISSHSQIDISAPSPSLHTL
jgi:hypothetical protein